jgi:restriction system protein
MKIYYRVMLGRKSVHAAECFAGGFIGTDFLINEDLSRKLPDEWRAFNKQFISLFLAQNPGSFMLAKD